VGQELAHRLVRPVGPVGVVDVLDLGTHLRAVGQQPDHRRLVGDQRPHLAGVGGDQREPHHGPAAAAEDVRRFPAEHRQQPVHVIGLLLGRHILADVFAAAVADAARVVRYDRMLAGQRAGEPGEAGAVHRRADEQKQRAGTPPLVVQPCARHVQGVNYRV
jgi:hypothetical protein